MKNRKRDQFLQNFPLPKGWQVKKENEKGYHVLLIEDGSVFQLDFRKNKSLSHSQTLVQAIGFKNQPLSILDITAGWAKSAFLMRQLGCQVTAIESNPFVFYLVQESLEYNNADTNQFQIKLDNSLNYLKSLNNPLYYPDIIFMDPMFEGRKKSLSKKSLRILKEITGETTDKQALFNRALLKAKKRVVVKRHKLDKPLQKNILCSFKGHSVCYDVFNPIGEDRH
ncbi:MAG: class I SAM-dependent methyltransferase [Oligoflexia bacterium]|nr:class I SAM-dependent methyltransferase [Oligoflexia bacterium]